MCRCHLDVLPSLSITIYLCFSSVASGLELVDEPGLQVLYDERVKLPILWLSGSRLDLKKQYSATKLFHILIYVSQQYLQEIIQLCCLYQSVCFPPINCSHFYEIHIQTHTETFTQTYTNTYKQIHIHSQALLLTLFLHVQKCHVLSWCFPDCSLQNNYVSEIQLWMTLESKKQKTKKIFKYYNA